MSGPRESCPACGAALAERQEWCLRCGNAARTRIEPASRWRTKVVLASAVALCLALAIAFAIAGALSPSSGTNVAHAAGATGASGTTSASGATGATP